MTKLYEEKSTVKLYNDYKGLTVTSPATVIALDNDTLTLKTEKYQLICLKDDGETTIETDLIPGTITAKVPEVNIKQATVKANQLIISSHFVNRRSQIRVCPAHPIPASITRNRRASGELMDISLYGACIRLSRSHFDYHVFGKGEGITIELELTDLSTGKTHPIVLDGAIRNIIPEGDNQYYRLGIQTYPPVDVAMIVGRFVNTRKVEICRELDQRYAYELKIQEDEEALKKKPSLVIIKGETGIPQTDVQPG